MEITKATTRPQTSALSAPHSEPAHSSTPVTAMTAIMSITNVCECRIWLSFVLVAAASIEGLRLGRALVTRETQLLVPVAMQVTVRAAGLAAAIRQNRGYRRLTVQVAARDDTAGRPVAIGHQDRTDVGGAHQERCVR